MFNTQVSIRGEIQVYGIRNGIKTLDWHHSNTIDTTLYTNLRTVLISRAVEYGVDAIGWGSYSSPGGTFVDSDYAGTTSTGTQGALIQSAVGSISAKFSGTFAFGGAKSINYFQLGRGYVAAGAGVSSLFTSLYAHDSSLLTGSTGISYDTGDSFIVDWTITVGS